MNHSYSYGPGGPATPRRMPGRANTATADLKTASHDTRNTLPPAAAVAAAVKTESQFSSSPVVFEYDRGRIPRSGNHAAGSTLDLHVITGNSSSNCSSAIRNSNRYDNNDNINIRNHRVIHPLKQNPKTTATTKSDLDMMEKRRYRDIDLDSEDARMSDDDVDQDGDDMEMEVIKSGKRKRPMSVS